MLFHTTWKTKELKEKNQIGRRSEELVENKPDLLAVSSTEDMWELECKYFLI